MINKKLKMFLSLLLVGVLTVSGLAINLPFAQASNKNVELTKLKTDLETNGMLYITDNTPVDTQKKINFNKEDITTKITSIKSQNYSQEVASNIKNIVVDATLLNNKDVLNKVRVKYNNGAKIVITNKNIKLSDAYSLMGENIPDYIKQSDTNDKLDKLTTVAISMFKDSVGNIQAAKLNVEINNLDEALRIIIISLRDDNNTSFFKNKEQAFIQTIKPALASLASSWSPVEGWSSYDSWQTCVVQWSINLLKNPGNPYNSKYWCMGETPVTVTPNSGYYSGGVNILQTSNSSGLVNDYAPKSVTNASTVSVSFGLPPAASISCNFGSRMSMITDSNTGIGHNNIKFSFWPVNSLGSAYPVSNQTNYDAAAQYYQYATWYGQGFSYTVDMYRYVGAGMLWYATASHSGLSVSGY